MANRIRTGADLIPRSPNPLIPLFTIMTRIAYNRAVQLPYPIVCLLLGLVLGWAPYFLHGPIPDKLSSMIAPDPNQSMWIHVKGAVSVWGYYVARMSIGFFVGITVWPRQWYLRGPMCGFLLILPLGIMALGLPPCGPRCMSLNVSTGSLIGFTVAGLAYLITGKHRW